MISIVGDGKSTLFWTENWLHGKSIAALAPHLFALVPKRRANKRTVEEALTGNRWIQDIQGSLSVTVLSEYLVIWDLVSDVLLRPDEADDHRWRLTESGLYTAKSTYRAFFFGSVAFEPWELIWKSWAPKKCQFFLWLAAHNRCWTADRLARRGLPHPSRCPLCDQEEETIQHVLTSCVFSRQVWFLLFRRYGFPELSPQAADVVFCDWWLKINGRVPGSMKRGLNSLVILGAWMLWKHRNDCVFNGASPSVQQALRQIADEGNLWCLAGARGLAHLEVAVS